MISFKKLSFAPVFLIIFAVLVYQISTVLTDYQFLFSLDNTSLIHILTTCALFLLTSLSFILFATFANSWKIIAPVVLIALSLPVIFIPQPISFVLSIGFLLAFVISSLTLDNKLKTYLNFQPSVLLTPNIKTLCTMLIFVTSFGFYLTSSANIKQNGFSLPDSLIDTVLQAVPMPGMEANTPPNQSIPGLPNLTQENIDLLKQNPQALEQFGLDPSVLDSITPTSSQQTSSTNPLQSSVKTMVQAQLDQVIKPYLTIIPIFVALILFLTLNWIVSILGIFLSPILWGIFSALTKSGFATFTTEMREVKKLVV